MNSSTRALNSQYVYAAALKQSLQTARQWLDLGCGHQFLPEWMPPHEQNIHPGTCRAVGIDMDAAAIRQHPGLRLRLIGTIDALPFASSTFDLVTANMVVEHLEHPEEVFREVARVLQPGGTLIVHTPNSAGYTTTLTRLLPAGWRPRLANILQGRLAEDVYPTFYRANTISDLRDLARQSGLTVNTLQTIESSPQLYRVPVVGAIEQRVLIAMRSERFASWRPCILGRFAKP